MNAGTPTRPTISLPKALPHQLPVLLDPARFKVVVCGRRWGKTALGLMACVKGHGPHRGALKGAIDGGRIAQLSSNLANNALQHGEKRAAVEVHLDGRDKDCIAMSVTNVGHIDGEMQQRMFEPFHGSARESGAPKRGLGLGLYIVKQIVEAHDGRIDVECAANRTVFRATIPRTAATR